VEEVDVWVLLFVFFLRRLHYVLARLLYHEGIFVFEADDIVLERLFASSLLDYFILYRERTPVLLIVGRVRLSHPSQDHHSIFSSVLSQGLPLQRPEKSLTLLPSCFTFLLVIFLRRGGMVVAVILVVTLPHIRLKLRDPDRWLEFLGLVRLNRALSILRLLVFLK